MSVTAQLYDDYFVLFPDKRGQTNKSVLQHGPRPLALWHLPTSHFPCVFLTLLPEGHGTDPAELWEGKSSSRSVRALAEQGLEANSVETLAAQYSQWFGRSRGEEVKPGEGTERKYQVKKGEGDRVNVADITQLRRGSCTWKIHHQGFL